MGGLTKLGLALILVFVLFLLALAVELLYVLWYRRRFPRAPPGALDTELADAILVAGEPRASPNSKELLLYLFCWKNQSRIEPTSAAVMPGFSHPPGSASPSAKPAPSPPPPPPPASSAAVDAEMAKWRGLYASRVLFTITEEEKEGTDSDGGSARFAVGRLRVAGEKGVDEQVEQAVASDLQVAEVEEEEKGVVDGPTSHLTPFSTPCSSPPFYTPTPSPTRLLDAGAAMEIPLYPDASDDEGFSPAAEKLPAESSLLDGDGGKRGGQGSSVPAICTANAGK